MFQGRATHGRSGLEGRAPTSHEMNFEITPAAEGAQRPAWQRWLRGAENSLAIAALTLMVLLPIAEIVLRKFFHSGIAASSTLVQHLTLLVGMIGGAIAARESRLLSLSTATHFFRGGWKTFSQIFNGAFAAAISFFLCTASIEFVSGSKRLGKILAYGIPVWAVQLFLVAGFAIIAVRLVWHSSPKWWGRFVALLLAALLIGIALHPPVSPEKLRVPALAILVTATILGAPVFTTLGGAAVILLWTSGEPIASVPLNHYRLTTNPTLPSLPLFTLAGYFLAEGGAAKRLVNLFQALVGNVRGGPAIVTTLVCAFFTSFTGASGVTILALGGVLMPVLHAARYSERNALGLLTGAGSLGMLFPPCLPPILYAVIASSGGAVSISMEDMFKGGFLPGLLLVVMTAAWGIKQGKRREATELTPFNFRTALTAAWTAKWELLIPVVALTALFGGFATPVEAAALTALYAFIVNVVICRDLKIFNDVPCVMTECGLLMGGVLLILGVALGFTHYLIDAQIPDAAVAWATGTIKSKWLFLLALNLVLLVIGGVVEIYAAIVVVVPILVPLGAAFGIDPVHLGIIFLANMELGFIAPPVGLNLLLASYRFNKSMTEVTRASLPMLVVMIVGVLLITYVPWLTTWLPRLLKQ